MTRYGIFIWMSAGPDARLRCLAAGYSHVHGSEHLGVHGLHIPLRGGRLHRFRVGQLADVCHVRKGAFSLPTWGNPDGIIAHTCSEPPPVGRKSL